MSRSKEYKAIKNYIHNELGLTIEQLIEIMYGYAYKNWWNWKGLIWQNIL